EPHAMPVDLDASAEALPLEFVSIPAPQVEPVARPDRVEVDAFGQPQPREQRVAGPLLRGPAPPFRGDVVAPTDAIDILGRRRDVPPAPGAAGRVRSAAEPDPGAVLPVFQIVPRLAARPRDVGDLVLAVPRSLQPL